MRGRETIIVNTDVATVDTCTYAEGGWKEPCLHVYLMSDGLKAVHYSFIALQQQQDAALCVNQKEMRRNLSCL